MIEKVGGLTFRDGILVSDFDAKAEIEKRGGYAAILKESLKYNALLRQLSGHPGSQ